MPVIIKSTKDGFRRCGVPHTTAPVEYPDDHWSEDDLGRLMAEPRLIVTIVPAHTDGAGDNSGEVTIAKSDTDVAGDLHDAVADIETVDSRLADTGQDENSRAVSQALLEAARTAVAAGDTIKSGAPDIQALEAILGRSVNADERDRAWAAIQAQDEV